MPISSANPRAANKSKKPRAIRRFFMVISRNSNPCYEPSSVRFAFPLKHAKWGVPYGWAMSNSAIGDRKKRW
jgi:hypothetical protein